MKKEKIENVMNFADASSNVLGLVNPALSAIPLITYAIRRVVGLISDNDIVKRIKKIEKELKNKKISIDEFKEKIITLPEHEKYFISNSLQHIIIKCIPETVDIYISIFIDCIMKEEHNLEEELCEIIESLNSNDIILLKKINSFLDTGFKNEYLFKSKEKKLNIEKNKKENLKIEKYNNNHKNELKMLKMDFIDRNIILKNTTIFWKDFRTFCQFPEIPLNYLLLLNDDEESFYGALFAKSLMKLNDLGVLQVDYLVTVGTANNLNIDRFHITLLGKRILTYVSKK